MNADWKIKEGGRCEPHGRKSPKNGERVEWVKGDSTDILDGCVVAITGNKQFVL